MPDQTPDPIHRLTELGQSLGGEPMDVMSPSEVRRRGDRRRRRTTAAAGLGALAAIAVIVTPLAVLGAGGDTSSDVLDPADRGTPAPLVRSLDGVELDQGMSEQYDGLRATVGDDGPGWSESGLCSGDPIPTEGLADRLVADVGGPQSHVAVRELLLYDSEDAAARTLEDILDETELCGAEPGSDGAVYSVEAGGLPGDSFVVTRTGTPAVIWWQVARLGHAVLVSSGSEVPPAPALAKQIEADTEVLVPVAEQVCAVIEADCAPPASETPDEEGANASDPEPAGIPGDLPLTSGWPEPSLDGTLEGPSSDVPFVELTACDQPLPLPASDDVLGARLSEPELYRSRQAYALPDTEAAAAYVDQVEQFYEACAQTQLEGLRTYYEFRPSDLGDQSITVAFIPADSNGAPALGLEVLQVVRVGRGVVLDHVSTGGLGDEATIRRQYTQQAEDLGGVVDALCALTEDGC